jgi:N-acetylglutamate synthase-like GNAT family acetyltransferase
MVGLVIGHCEPWVDGQHYYLNEMCVDPHAQRGGVGEALLAEVCKTLRAAGVSSVYLLTETSTGAESFFRKLGFEADEASVKLWRDV